MRFPLPANNLYGNEPVTIDIPDSWDVTVCQYAGADAPAMSCEQIAAAIDAVNHAAWKIATGNANVIIAGSCESYSQRAAKFSMSVDPYKLIPPTAIPNQLSPNKEECTDRITNSDLMATK